VTVAQQDVKERAARLLVQMKELSSSEMVALADDVLLLLNDLRDNWEVQSTSSPRIAGRSFAILSPLIYSLESDPDQTLRNSDQRSFLMGLLQDLGTGRIVAKHRTSSS